MRSPSLKILNHVDPLPAERHETSAWAPRSPFQGLVLVGISCLPPLVSHVPGHVLSQLVNDLFTWRPRLVRQVRRTMSRMGGTCGAVPLSGPSSPDPDGGCPVLSLGLISLLPHLIARRTLIFENISVQAISAPSLVPSCITLVGQPCSRANSIRRLHFLVAPGQGNT
jgi:hypothetical protein